MIKPLTLAFLSCAALPGCVTQGAYEPNVSQLIGDQFVGRPVSELMQRYGAPLRSMPLQGETVYTWERSDTLYYSGHPPAHVRCQLDAYVREDGIVRTLGTSGQGGCLPKFIP